MSGRGHAWAALREEVRKCGPVNFYPRRKWRCAGCGAESIWLMPGDKPRPGTCPAKTKRRAEVEARAG